MPKKNTINPNKEGKSVFRDKALIKKIIKQCIENDVVFIGVFGSFDKGKSKSLFDLIDLEEKLTQLLGRKVDLGIFDSISPYIINEVKKEMEVIYEKG
jgi:predicted nucleotidyltransferase